GAPPEVTGAASARPVDNAHSHIAWARRTRRAQARPAPATDSGRTRRRRPLPVREAGAAAVTGARLGRAGCPARPPRSPGECLGVGGGHGRALLRGTLLGHGRPVLGLLRCDAVDVLGAHGVAVDDVGQALAVDGEGVVVDVAQVVARRVVAGVVGDTGLTAPLLGLLLGLLPLGAGVDAADRDAVGGELGVVRTPVDRFGLDLDVATRHRLGERLGD